MPDQQIHPTGDVSTPADYVLAPAAELMLKMVFASFDGSGAAGDFRPLLRIISDAGTVAGEAGADTTVAAGGSADVTWFPRVAAAAAAAPTTAALPLAVMARVDTQTFASSINDAAVTWERVHTTDTATFQLLGTAGVRVLKDGVYAAWLNIYPDSDWPAAGAVPIRIEILTGTQGFGGVNVNTYAVHPNIDVFSPPSFITDAPAMQMFPLVANRTITGGLFNHTGANFVISSAFMWVVRLGDYIDGSP